MHSVRRGFARRFSTRVVATAMLATGAVAITAGTAYADPATVVEKETIQLEGEDQGVGYDTRIDIEKKTVTTVLDAGVFRLDKAENEDEKPVVEIVSTATDEVIGVVPLTYELGDQVLTVDPVVSEGGSVLTLEPKLSEEAAKAGDEIAEPLAATSLGLVKPVAGSLEDLTGADQLVGGVIGAAVGGALGAAVGCLIGLFVGCIPGVAVGGVGGFVVGFAISGDNPIIDLRAILEAFNMGSIDAGSLTSAS